MKILWTICIGCLLLLPLLQGVSLNIITTTTSDHTPAALLAGAKLQYQDNITILYVNGSNYQMGYQHGYLLQDQVQQNIRAFLFYASPLISREDLLALWNMSLPYVPQEYLEELQGIADGANISVDDIKACIMGVEYSDLGCYGFATWGPATTDGQVYHARSFDLPSIIKDPETGRYAHENTVLVVRSPANGSACLAPSIAGSFHTGGGMNEHGVCLGIQNCWSKDQTFQGTPYHFRVQQALDYATTAQEAITIVNANRTHGYNFIVSQASPPEGYCVEQTANLTYLGTHNDSTESQPPFWALDHVIRRTNIFLDPTIAETQRRRYDPTGLIGFLNLLFYTRTNCPFFAIYQLYSSVSYEISSSWGSLDLNETMAALQHGYRGDHHLLLRIFEFLGKGTSLAEAWNQWTACPATGDMVVSFATHDQLAYKTQPHYFNLYDLLQAS
ncbi:MAG: hypothetical protein JXA00_02230 [Candidatus Thermoplasmatota archaeon]|nr:hypothetical protein [Candidatus Thermoplasmatota archaeon]